MLVALITEISERGARLPQSSSFAGVLTPFERDLRCIPGLSSTPNRSSSSWPFGPGCQRTARCSWSGVFGGCCGALRNASFTYRLLAMRAFLAARRTAPRASFTASLVGNASAISGSRRTMFELSANRAAYLPRTKPFGKSERLYSRRSLSVPDDLAFFI